MAAEWRAPWHGVVSKYVLCYRRVYKQNCAHLSVDIPNVDRKHAPVPPPEHPTFDLKIFVQAALDEDLGGLGDLTSISTCPPSPLPAPLLPTADMFCIK